MSPFTRAPRTSLKWSSRSPTILRNRGDWHSPSGNGIPSVSGQAMAARVVVDPSLLSLILPQEWERMASAQQSIHTTGAGKRNRQAPDSRISLKLSLVSSPVRVCLIISVVASISQSSSWHSALKTLTRMRRRTSCGGGGDAIVSSSKS